MADEGKPTISESEHAPTGVAFKIPDAMPLLSADILVSQHSIDKGLFYLTFFQSRPPIIEQGAPAPDKLQADCIVRLALTPQVAAALIQTLQKNFERFQEKISKAIAEAEAQMKEAEGRPPQ